MALTRNNPFNRLVLRVLRQILTPNKPSTKSKDNRWVVILLAFLVALSFWAVVTINRPYQTSLEYPVLLPGNFRLGDGNTPSIRLEVEGEGIDLLIEKLRRNPDTLVFPLREIDSRNGYFRVSDFQDLIAQKLPSNVKISRIRPERIFFDYESEFFKRVPLRLQGPFPLAPAYQLEEAPISDTDSVSMWGPREVIDSISEWTLSLDPKLKIRNQRRLEVAIIDTLEGVRVIPKIVTVRLKPRKYTEVRLNIPIQVTQIPSGRDVRLNHTTITCSCLLPLNEYEDHLQRARLKEYYIPFEKLDPSLPFFVPQPDFPEAFKVIRCEPQQIGYTLIDLQS